MPLNARTRKIGSVAIVDLNGKLILGDSLVLRETLNELLASGCHQIIVNMANVAYVDSAGLGELVAKYTTASKAGGAIKLLHLQAKLKALMQMTKLHILFPFFDNEQEAIASFN